MLRKLLPAGAIVVLCTGPAFAQIDAAPSQPTIGIPLNREVPPTAEEIEKRKAADRAYNAAMHKIPDKKPAADPWGSIRPSSSTAKNKQQ
jgi:hypothetical protein